MKTSMPLCATALAAALAAAAFGVSAQVAAPAGPASLSITRLQTIYLRCADVATRSPLDAVDFAFCAAVGDALRDRAFDGSFERLIAWWHGARTPDAAPAEATAGDAAGGRTDTASLQSLFSE